MYTIRNKSGLMVSGYLGWVPVDDLDIVASLKQIIRDGGEFTTTKLTASATIYDTEEAAKEALDCIIHSLTQWSELIVDFDKLAEITTLGGLSYYTDVVREYVKRKDPAEYQKIQRRLKYKLAQVSNGKFKVEKLTSRIVFAGKDMNARPAVVKKQQRVINEKSCKICNVYIPTMEYFDVDAGTMGRTLCICPFCVARLGREASMIEERFKRVYPDLYEQYATELITRAL